MSDASSHAAESGLALLAKVTPPVSVSLATIMGVQVSELVLWGTLIYTVMLILHKALMIFRDLRSGGRHD